MNPEEWSPRLELINCHREAILFSKLLCKLKSITSRLVGKIFGWRLLIWWIWREVKALARYRKTRPRRKGNEKEAISISRCWRCRMWFKNCPLATPSGWSITTSLTSGTANWRASCNLPSQANLSPASSVASRNSPATTKRQSDVCTSARKLSASKLK